MVILFVATRNAHKIQEIRAILGRRFQYLTLDTFPGAPETTEDADTFAGNATKKAVELAGWLAQQKTEHGRCNAELYVLADDSGLEVDALNGAPGVHSARFAAIGERTPRTFCAHRAPVPDGQPPHPSLSPSEGERVPDSSAVALAKAEGRERGRFMGSGNGRSARGSGNAPDRANNAKLLHLLKNVPVEKRTARFRCVLALTAVLPEARRGSSPVCYADELELQTELFDGVCEGHIGFAPQGQGGFGYDPLFIPDGYQQSFAELGEEVKNKLSHRAKALAGLRARLVNR
ncbi:MAG: hypothetical protein DME21_11925 [Verrucomicrobia bacterium]|nr:MAG: hypothetical protein DME21_11925 [Verrucomicrobiota bacterium]